MSSCHCPRATSERERESGEVFASFQSPTVFTAHTRWTRFCLQTCVEEVSSQSHSSETVSQGKVGGLVGISFPWQGAAHKSQTSNRTLSKAVLPCSAHPQCSQRDQTTSRVPLFKKRSYLARPSRPLALLMLVLSAADQANSWKRRRAGKKKQPAARQSNYMGWLLWSNSRC